MADPATQTDDAFLGGRVILRQPSPGYRAAIDPVLLAAAVPAADGDRILDVGTGVGTAALCLATRAESARVTGIEVERSLGQLAAHNVTANGLGRRVDILIGDLERPPPRLAPRSFGHVMANPPYMAPGQGRPSIDPIKAQATIEGDASLAVWIGFCLSMVRPGGTITVIHRADRMAELLTLLEARAGSIVVFPLWSHNPFGGARVRKTAKRVIVQAVADRCGPLQLSGGMILHEPDGRYTHAAERVLRGGNALTLVEGAPC